MTGQGTYRVASDSDFPDLGIAAAPASGTRTDLVVLEVVDSQVISGSTNLARFRALTGVSALTSEKTVIPLARISVPAGTTSIQASNITTCAARSKVGVLRSARRLSHSPPHRSPPSPACASVTWP